MRSGTAILSFRCCWLRESPSLGGGAGFPAGGVCRKRRSRRALDGIFHTDPGVAGVVWHLVSGRHLVIALVLLAQVFRSGPVTSYRVQGAIAVYLLFGVGWAHAYHITELLHPGSFNSTTGNLNSVVDWAYYSYVTLSTVGYGDITPVRPIARTLSMGEAMTGQLYLAVLIAQISGDGSDYLAVEDESKFGMRGIHLTQVTTTGSVVAHGTGSEDYPRTLAELEARFSSEEACREYLFRLRWPAGCKCLRCGESKTWPLRSGRWQCARCGHQASVTAGTISGHPDAADGLVPGDVVDDESEEWDQRPGTPAGSGLGKLPDGLGVFAQTAASHGKTRAGTSLGKSGGGRNLSGWAGRGYARSADREQGADCGGGRGGRQRRIRMRRIPDASAHSLISFIQESVEPGSVVHTDGWLGYEPLQGRGYIHRLTFLRGQQKSPSELLPRVHRVVSLLKRWLLGTHRER